MEQNFSLRLAQLGKPTSFALPDPHVDDEWERTMKVLACVANALRVGSSVILLLCVNDGEYEDDWTLLREQKGFSEPMRTERHEELEHDIKKRADYGYPGFNDSRDDELARCREDFGELERRDSKRFEEHLSEMLENRTRARLEPLVASLSMENETIAMNVSPGQHRPRYSRQHVYSTREVIMRVHLVLNEED